MKTQTRCCVRQKFARRSVTLGTSRQIEHITRPSPNSPRVGLPPIKGKPVVRQGRKARSLSRARDRPATEVESRYMLINRRGGYQACRSFSPSSFLLLAAACVLLASAATSVRAATVNVPAGGDLQAALNSAQPGDTIVLQAGATYVGPVTLPVKTGSDYITIQSSALAALPPAGTRVSPAYAALMPKIVSPGFNEPALATTPGAHHFQFIGVEFAKQTPDVQVGDLIMLGDGTSAQNSLDKVPHHLTFDRCYMHGEPSTPLKRGIALNSAETSIINSYISDFKNVGQDTQAICGWNGPGPFHIINNYLEGAGENIMFGGAIGYIPGVNPADIEIRRNYFY